MAKGFIKVFLMGNLGADPEAIRYTQSGTPALNLSIATSETWKDKQTGEAQEETSWHRVVLYKRLAEIAHQYLRKGSKVWIEGRIKATKWQKEGQTQRSYEIIAYEMQMLDSKSSSPGETYPGNATAQQNSPAPQETASQSDLSEDSFDDDIPF